MGEQIVEEKGVVRELITEIAKDMDVEAEKVTDVAHFINDLEFDSLSLLEIHAFTEKKFDISIPISELKNLTSIDNVYEIVDKYKDNKLYQKTSS